MEIAPTHSPSQLQLQPLHLACQNGHAEAVRMLIETFHVDPNTAVEVGDSFRKKGLSQWVYYIQFERFPV